MLGVNFYDTLSRCRVFLAFLALFPEKTTLEACFQVFPKSILEIWLPNDTLYIFDAKFGNMWGLFAKYVVTEPAHSIYYSVAYI